MRYLIVLLLAGCYAHTPQRLMELREPNAFTSTQPPRAVVECMNRNHRESRSLGQPVATERPDGSLDYAIKNPRNGLQEFYVVIKPTPGGSSMAVWTQSPYLRDTIEAGMLKGC